MIVTFFPRKLEQTRIFYEIMETVGWNPFARIIIDESGECLHRLTLIRFSRLFEDADFRGIFQITTNDGRLMKLLLSEVFMDRDN